MNIPSSLFLSAVTVVAAGALFVAALPAAEPESSATSGKELANRMSTGLQDSALVRAKIEMRAPDGTKQVLQLQIKERRTAASTDLLYQVQWPKERKGETVILHQDAGAAPRGAAAEGRCTLVTRGVRPQQRMGSDPNSDSRSPPDHR